MKKPNRTFTMTFSETDLLSANFAELTSKELLITSLAMLRGLLELDPDPVNKAALKEYICEAIQES